ncbi:MAG: LysR family transcriptional regulator [Ardenticatenaceae bacterium]|nr:LysR family transcriptional regulator [Anaerolineales bacterium]MCB8920306.1 LysR family transcriptional regulator [Ardenticatenaceae bacterium]
MIDLMKLQAFIYAADNLSFSEAARLLHLTQPTVSHHIKTLEQDFGVELFDRSGYTPNLTEAGRLLLPWAHKLLRQANDIQEIMDSLQQKIVGHLRIACSTTAGKYILPQLAARFCQRYPGIRVSIMACTPEHIVPQLLEGEANLAVISSYDLCGNGLECQEFFNDFITLIVPAEHSWAMRQSVEPVDLLEEKIIFREPTSGTRRVLMTELAKHDIGLDDLNIFLELGNAEAIVKTVQAGFAISFVSTLAATWAVSQKQVVAVPVAGLKLQRKVYMVRRSLDTPNRPQEAFWSFIHHPSNSDLLRLARTS